MLEFRPIMLSDQDWISNKLAETNYRGCEYTFANNYIWKDIYHTEWAKAGEAYVTRNGTGRNIRYSYPAGRIVDAAIIEEMIADAREREIPFKMRGIVKEQMEWLEGVFPGRFLFAPDRDESDYIYQVDKLSSLSGKKLHGKRNHIARFKDNADWSYEKIVPDNLEECFRMTKIWCRKYGCAKSEALRGELCAVEEAFRHYAALKLEGGLIRREGGVVAYSIGEPLSQDTYVVHIEKAFHDIQGAYPMINQQFVLHNCQDYIYVNREEDTGDEGLRKAKLSYYPDILLDKYTAVLRNEVP